MDFFQESDDLTESRNAPFNDRYDVDDDDDDDGEETDLVSCFDFVNILTSVTEIFFLYFHKIYIPQTNILFMLFRK